MVWIWFYFTNNILLAELQDNITCIVEDLLFYDAKKNHIRGSDEVLESDFWLCFTFKRWYNNKYNMISIKELPIVY